MQLSDAEFAKLVKSLLRVYDEADPFEKVYLQIELAKLITQFLARRK